MKLVIANWKNHKNLSEVNEWLDVFLNFDFSNFENKFQIIICPPFPFLLHIKNRITEKNLQNIIKVGSQDVAYFDEGAYTGEVGIKSLVGLIDYAIIGHSERRYYQEEITRILTTKVNWCKNNGIEPIFCVRDASDPVVEGVNILAYEPISAIGTNHAEEIQKVLDMKKYLKVNADTKYIYGGSVNNDNAQAYLGNENIDGLLVGTTSLDATKFFEILK